MKTMPFIFDTNSGVRERLFLLSVLNVTHEESDSANWAYDSHRDTWSHVGGDELKVEYEASHSLAILAKRGINRSLALAMIGYPEQNETKESA